jgi:hypothetical protein
MHAQASLSGDAGTGQGFAATVPFCDGFDAFCFLGFSAFGLRTSLFVFFWLFAITPILLWRRDLAAAQAYCT